MNQPESYTDGNYFQRQDATATLNALFPLLSWQRGGEELIIDIGCGPGDVTMNILLPRISKIAKVKQIVGADQSQEMVDFANKKNASSVSSFEQMNLLLFSSTSKIKYHGEFTKAFSFYCLNWIRDLRTAMKNLYNILAPGGEALLMFTGHHTFYSVYEEIKKIKKWESYMEDISSTVSPYHHSEKPAEEFSDVLKSAGFIIKTCECNDTDFKFSSLKAFEDAMKPVNPHYHKVPPNLQDEYQECANKIFLDITKQWNVGNKDGIIMKYNLISAVVRKPAS